MTKPSILVTGANGNVGSSVVLELEKLGLEFAIADYKLIESTRKSRLLDFKNPKTFKPALEGIKQIFLMRPPAISDVKKYFEPFLDVCKELEVEQIVFLSLQGAENNSVTPHYKIEKYIEKVGLAYTFIRPSFFMQNLSSTHLQEIKDGEIYVPAGKGKTSFIDVRDIAAVTAKVINEKSKHINLAYEITGIDALTYSEVAEIMSKQLNKKIKYKNPNLLQFYFQKRKEGLANGYIIVMAAIYTIARIGKAAQTTDTFKQLMGRDPIRFSQFISDYLKIWK